MQCDDIEFLEKNEMSLLSTIAKGGYGVVYYVYSQQYKANFALKKIPADMFNEAEVECLKSIDDPHIVSLYKIYRYQHHVYLLMEYCPSDLNRLINKKQDITPVQLKKYIYDVLLAIKACHNQNIAHSDVKPSNFLIDQHGRIKICDFGLSSINKNRPTSMNWQGTRLYQAPEIINHKKYNPIIADIWALGVTIYFMATKTYPFFSTDIHQLLRKIDAGLYTDDMIADLQLKHLISRCLQKDIAKRATIDELLQSPYFHDPGEEDGNIKLENRADPLVKSSGRLFKTKMDLRKHMYSLQLITRNTSQLGLTSSRATSRSSEMFTNSFALN